MAIPRNQKLHVGTDETYYDGKRKMQDCPDEMIRRRPDALMTRIHLKKSWWVGLWLILVVEAGGDLLV